MDWLDEAAGDRPRRRVVLAYPRSGGSSCTWTSASGPGSPASITFTSFLVALPDARRLRRRRGRRCCHRSACAPQQNASAGRSRASPSSSTCARSPTTPAPSGSIAGLRAAGHRRRLGRHAAGEPAGRMGPGGGPGQPGRAQAEGPRCARSGSAPSASSPSAARRSPSSAVGWVAEQLGLRRGRGGHGPADGRRVRGGPRRRLRDALVRADRAARRTAAAARDRRAPARWARSASSC